MSEKITIAQAHSMIEQALGPDFTIRSGEVELTLHEFHEDVEQFIRQREDDVHELAKLARNAIADQAARAGEARLKGLAPPRRPPTKRIELVRDATGRVTGANVYGGARVVETSTPDAV